ncbi:MAG TPA: helix-turn-helix transcriptional regulator [Candidatus Coprocola pullicola]|nr:helix-turn-helix transcriptional regulator [Candidatus Coprocola pullicola]
MTNQFVNTERLKLERTKKELTYGDMSRLLGYKSKSTYMYIERGITIPRLPIMRKIAVILGKPIGYFFDIEVQEFQTINTNK